MEYNFRDIEKKWQQRWVEQQTYRVTEDPTKKKFYVLNMFPYPSGAGLHVGHPLGYIASDIYARYKRQQGFNVLNPMGYDAYGLPAEQYAIQTGQHPEKTTFENIDRYRSQLDKIGFCFDWSREVRTCAPGYYHWTQWAFMKMFQSFYCNRCQSAQPIEKLIEHFCERGTEGLDVAQSEELHFTADEWKAMSERQQQEVLMNYRIAYLGETMVNWCAGLGTVLANDEVVDGVSVRGGYPVVQKKMRQWCLRVSAYAQRLLDGLDHIQWTDSLKETQRNWIGRSEGTEMEFKIAKSADRVGEGTDSFTIFTTRADTIFGVTFMVLAPESELVDQLTTPEQRPAVDEYLAYVKKRTERERQMDHRVTGVFSGSYAVNPLTGENIPIWIAEYVLAGYGTGAIMAVPAHDSRDYAFAKHFNLPIIPLIEGADISEESFDAKEGIVMNSSNGEFSLNGLVVDRAAVDQQTIFPLELNTMPGFAGSSAYYLRYMDPHNDTALVSKEADEYWQSVDLYVGGTEHATGHLIYSRFWNKFLFDLGVSCKEEPFQKLVNQGMIQGRSNFVYRDNEASQRAGHPVFVSLGLKNQYADVTPIHVDVNIVSNDMLDIEAFKAWRPEYADAEFVLEDGKYICGWAIEKMSKSMFNVVNPDMIVEKYGADTLRLYEMFLGPVEQSKPWDTNGIDGCHRFLKKFWNLVTTAAAEPGNEPTADNLKSVHKLIKKVSEDIEAFSYNTSIAAFMICVNELSQQKCRNHELMKSLVTLIAPFAPHIAEELWQQLGGEGSVCDAQWPAYDEKYLVESSVKMGVAFNGKTRFDMQFAADADNNTIQQMVMADERTARYIDGKQVVKVIIVPKRMVNIVCK